MAQPQGPLSMGGGRLRQVMCTRLRLRGFLRGLAKGLLYFVLLLFVSAAIYGHGGAPACMILMLILFPWCVVDELKRDRISDVADYATVAILGWGWLYAISVSLMESLRKG